MTNDNNKTPRKPKNPAYIDWRRSEAKCIIIEDLVSGALPVDRKECSAEVAWELLYADHVEFTDVPFAQFKARLSSHRTQVKKNLARSKFEEQCLVHDRSLFPRKVRNSRGEIVFDLHPARDLLREDVAANKHIGTKPRHLWRTRSEYQEFDLNIFRSRIYQEVRRVKFLNYLQFKREEEKDVTQCKPPGTKEFRHPNKKIKTK